MTKRKTNTEFVNEVFKLVRNEYRFLEEYVNNATKIKCRHNICGHEWNVIPASFLRGTRCPKCFGGIKKTNKEFVQEVLELVGNEYIFLEKYINDCTKIKCRHNICGHEYNVVPSSFLQGRGCPNCKGKKISESKIKTDKHFKQEVYDLVGEEYEIIGDYINSDIKVKMKHNICGYEYKVASGHFLNDSTRCPLCNRPNYDRNDEQFKQQMHNLVGNEYTFIGEFINVATKIRCRHNACGCEWEVKPNNFIKGTRCPQCNESKGENLIRIYLEQENIKFEREYKFNNCRNKYSLPFDFYLPNSNLLIEYDGIQHFEPRAFFGGEMQFKIQKHNDNIKNEYCKDNNIRLIRIPYWDFDNIEGILANKLN